MTPLVAGISAAGNLLGSLFGSIGQRSANRRQRQYNLMMYERQRADNLKFWKMQNKYNSPASQMSRLRTAGLNPNLMYGHMSSDSASSLRAPSPGAFNPENVFKSFDGSSIGSYLSYRNLQERNQNINAQTNAARSTADLKDKLALSEMIKNTGRLIDNAKSRVDLKKARSLYDTQVAAQKQALRNAKKDEKLKSQGVRNAVLDYQYTLLKMSNTRAERNRIKAQINSLKKDVQLKKADLYLRSRGMNYSDELWQRVLTRFLGIDLRNGKMPKLYSPFKVRKGSFADFMNSSFWSELFNVPFK